jgi:hypothetical protein
LDRKWKAEIDTNTVATKHCRDDTVATTLFIGPCSDWPESSNSNPTAEKWWQGRGTVALCHARSKSENPERIWAQLVVLCGGSTLCGDFEHKPSTGQPPKVPLCQNGPVVGLHKHALVALFF